MKHDIHCDNCKRYIGTAYGTVVGTFKCGNSKCKKNVEVKIISADRLADIKHKFTKEVK